jgi:S1-C subfamily serine protease
MPRLGGRRAAILAVGLMVLGACTAPPPDRDAVVEQQTTTSITAPTGSLPSAATTSTTVPTTTVQQARDYTVRVRNPDCLSTGTAFSVGGGRLVTNRHVARGAQVLQLSTWDGRDLTARVVAIDAGDDLALLEVDGGFRPEAKLAPSDARTRLDVSAVGYALGNELQATKGTVLDYVGGPGTDSPRTLRSTVFVRPGNSGGPLLTASSEVVGVVFAYESSTLNALAVPISAVKTFLAKPGGIAVTGCEQD